MQKGCNDELQPLQIDVLCYASNLPGRLILLSFDGHFLTGFTIKISFFSTLFLEKLIPREVLLHLIVGGIRNVGLWDNRRLHFLRQSRKLDFIGQRSRIDENAGPS
jgi:hypothetical protein